jgi:CubicO group peptidase (beta-lactamase class C family)
MQRLETLARPEDVGILPEKLDDLLMRARREVDEGLLPSCQIALAKDGQLVAFETFGDATNDTRYVIFSATKPFVASTVWTLLTEGKLRLDQRVAEIVPEFGANGKAVITLEQVMLHTAGFPTPIFNPLHWSDVERRRAAFASWALDYEPGTRFWYHPTSAHWVLADIIEVVTGEDFRKVVRGRVVEPIGLPRFGLGVPAPEQQDIAELELRSEPMTPDELEAFFGLRELPSTEADDENLVNLNDPRARAVGIPGGGAVATAADLALFYQELLHNSRGVWNAELLADATSRVRNNLPDPLMGVPASRGLGVVIAGDDEQGFMRGFGRTNSPRAFGHNGAAGQIAWGDPATGISFGYCTNGIDRHMLRQGRRGVGLSSRAAICAEVS